MAETRSVPSGGASPAIDSASSVNEASAVKLDAEDYRAEDLDSVIEGVLGSGNLNYAFLQSQQTSDALQTSGPQSGMADGLGDLGLPSSGGGASSPAADGDDGDDTSDQLGRSNEANGTNTGNDNRLPGDGSDSPSGTAGPGESAFTIGPVGAAALQSGSAAADGALGTAGAAGDEAEEQEAGDQNELPDTDPTPGPDDGPGPGGDSGGDRDTDIEISVDPDGDGEDEIEVEVGLDPVESIVGDIDLSVDLNVDLELIDVDVLTPVLILPEVFGGTGNDESGDTDISVTLEGPLDGDVATDVVLDPVEAIVGDIDVDIDVKIDTFLPFDLKDQLLGGTMLPGPGLGGSLHDRLLEVFGEPSGGNDRDLSAELSATTDGLPLAAVQVDVPLDPVEAIVGDIDIGLEAGVDLPLEDAPVVDEVLEDVVADAAAAVEDALGDAGDAPVVEEAVDDAVADAGAAVEDMLGDAGGAVDDLLGDAPAVEEAVEDAAAVEDAVGDAGGAVDDLLGDALEVQQALEDVVADADAAVEQVLVDAARGDEAGDIDLTVDAGLEIADQPDTAVDADVPLDPLEAVVGDIDVDLDAGADLLGADALEAAEADEDVLQDGAAADDSTDESTDDSTDDSADEVDLTADIGLEIADQPVASQEADMPLDAAEDIVGDIDLDLNAALDLLSAEDDSEPANGDGETSQELSAESADYNEGQASVSDLLLAEDGIQLDTEGGLTDGAEADVLPEPTGAISEGLGSVLDGQNDLSSGAGLFG